MTIAVSERWVEAPLRRFVEDARVRFALLLEPSGRVLGQHGFTRALDVMSACALAAAIRASSAELGRRLTGAPFSFIYHAGKRRQIFLSEASTTLGPFILFTAFDGESSLGLVQLYFRDFRSSLAGAAAEVPKAAASIPETFEADLNRHLTALFGQPALHTGKRPFFPNA